MKKNLFFFAAAAIAFAACSNEEILVDNGQQNGNESAIGFTTYAGKATRGAENSGKDYELNLKDHHTDFVVWGYKNTSSTLVFEKQLVEWKKWSNEQGATESWDYTPHRYWDKAADKYEFYAAAPKAANSADLGWTLNADASGDQDKSYITLTGVKLKGSNLNNVAANDVDYVESFASAPAIDNVKDIDLMIADKKPVATAAFTSTPVELDFIHILSRLNVTIQTTVKAPAVVTLTSLEIVGLIDGGDFNESLAVADGTGKISRWTRGTDKYTLAAKTNYTVENVTTKNKYVLQCLVIPQEAGLENIKLDGAAATVGTTTYTAYSSATTPYIKIIYTIDPDGDGTNAPAEEFTAYYNLATVFGVSGYDNGTVLAENTDLSGYYTKAGDVYTACEATAKADGSSTYYKPNTLAFNEGWMNTLNVTIDPTAIKFTGKVAKWDESANGNKDLDVK